MTVKRGLLLAVAAVLLVTGCGDDTADETTTATETSSARVYFLRDGEVWPVAREIPNAGDGVDHVLAELAEGPTDEETELGLTTSLPEDFEVTEIDTDGLTNEALAQIVYTLTQFPDTDVVEFLGEEYARDDFEVQTPSVLVESPLPFDEVTSPITATGTANTFEANFQYELLDADGNVVDENFVTATSGTGTRGTFEFTTADVDDVATLVVFESSAEDGSRMNEVEIPLNVAP